MLNLAIDKEDMITYYKRYVINKELIQKDDEIDQIFEKEICHKSINMKGFYNESLTDKNVIMKQKNLQLLRIIESHSSIIQEEEEER